ncbi:MAG: ribosome maturation factor RimP [Clostridia bacterium]|nr:ribosome maturation factor RimP [Clostridia bacterium]
MAKNHGAQGAKMNSIHLVEQCAQAVAQEMSLEFVEATLQKESRGKCLCVYVDKDGGLTLDDCERYHKRLQPMLEEIDYDIMEVSSPGVDRPIKTMRDFEKNRGNQVEVKLFAPLNGSKLYQGELADMTETTVTIALSEDETLTFERKGVALIKPVFDVDIDELEDVFVDEEE